MYVTPSPLENHAVLSKLAPGWAQKCLDGLYPGSHVVAIGDELSCYEGRLVGLELKDCFLVLLPGPSCKFAFLWRVPLTATIVEQLVSTGTSCLNISGTRVETSSNDDIYAKNPHTKGGFGHAGASVYGDSKGAPSYDPSLGRWPTNMILVHDNCKGKCSAVCPVRIMNMQSGDRPSTLTGRADPMKAHGNPGDNHGSSLFGGGNSKVYADQGGASRFFPQVANEEELSQWFSKLVAPFLNLLV